MKKRSGNPLARFRWVGINHKGKCVSGSILATSEMQVRNQLNAQSIAIRSLKQKPVSLFTRLTQGINKKEITIFTRQLSVMLATGVPIVQALKLVNHSCQKPAMKSLLTELMTQIESGNPIASTMRKASPLFDSFYIDLVTTGEQTGNLAEVFERIATHREKSERLNAKVIKALIYPTAVIFTSLLVTYLLLTTVIPQFEVMFADFGTQLPWLTRQVITLSSLSQSYGIRLLIASCLLLFALKLAYAKSYKAKRFINQLQLKVPVAGSLITKASIARFTRTLATSSSAGIPILTALKASAKNTANLQFQAGIETVTRDTASGIPLYIAMRNSEQFPEMVLQMVMIGEESGRLDDMLYKIANIYEFEIDNTVENLGKILEPLIIVFLGVVIGGLVISMYLPIFNLMSVLG